MHGGYMKSAAPPPSQERRPARGGCPLPVPTRTLFRSLESGVAKLPRHKAVAGRDAPARRKRRTSFRNKQLARCVANASTPSSGRLSDGRSAQVHHVPSVLASFRETVALALKWCGAPRHWFSRTLVQPRKQPSCVLTVLSRPSFVSAAVHAFTKSMERSECCLEKLVIRSQK